MQEIPEERIYDPEVGKDTSHETLGGETCTEWVEYMPRLLTAGRREMRR